jgi:hypothetical protein
MEVACDFNIFNVMFRFSLLKIAAVNLTFSWMSLMMN